jgi:hypothetical protein
MQPDREGSRGTRVGVTAAIRFAAPNLSSLALSARPFPDRLSAFVDRFFLDGHAIFNVVDSTAALRSAPPYFLGFFLSFLALAISSSVGPSILL